MGLVWLQGMSLTPVQKSGADCRHHSNGEGLHVTSVWVWLPYSWHSLLLLLQLFFFWHNGKHFSVGYHFKGVFSIARWCLTGLWESRAFHVEVFLRQLSRFPLLPKMSCAACTGKQFKTNYPLVSALGGWWIKYKKKKENTIKFWKICAF